MDLSDISSGSIRHLRAFINHYYEHSEALKALECDITTTSNPLLSALILRKMDTELRKRLEAYRATQEREIHTLPEVADIIQFLNIECNQAEDAGLHLPPTTHKASYGQSSLSKDKRAVKFTSDKNIKHVSMLTTQMNPCFACDKNDHKIYVCPSFKEKTPQERYQLVKKDRRCVSCLGSHDIKQCKSQATCKICHKRHHSLLHFQTQVQPSSRLNKGSTDNPPSSTEETNVSAVMASHIDSCSPSTVLLGTLLVQLTSPKGNSHVFRALLDSGSMCDFVSERAAQLLDIKRTHSALQVVGIAQTATHTKGMLHLNVNTLSGRTMAFQQPFLILDQISVDLPRIKLSQEVLHKAKAYTLADPTFHLPGGIDVLLGGSLFPRLLTNENHSLGPNLPHAIGSHFGYIIMGQAPCEGPTPLISNVSVSLLSTADVDLHASLQKFWLQEEPPSYSKKSEEKELCDRHFEETHFRDTDQRYVVRLPFKSGHQTLGTSKPSAEQRFHSLERKFKSQPEFRTLYVQGMTEYISQGHMVEVDKLDTTSPHYFLPHHGVVKEGSSTTKLRTVFDASSKTSSGYSLNDTLMAGPKLQTNICDILLHFRSHKVVFSCDIRQMYRQIKVHPDDQIFQLLLWRDDPSHDLSVYKLTRVTFGINSSPYLAIKTLNQLAIDEGSSFPDAARVLQTQTYVDDVISGAETEEEALDLQDQLISLLKRGGFELRKWCSNSQRLLQALSEDQLESPVFLQSEQPQFSILGLHWSPANDCFMFSLNIPRESCTKRQVLSLIAQIYDPCGFLAPVTMWAKSFMQLLWAKGLEWDDPLPSNLAEKWQTFVLHTKELRLIEIPRFTQIYQTKTLELHGFSDASESGYAAVIYFRSQSSQGEVVVRQIIAKTRVAPLKRVTLPRLELCGAHLLAQLVTYCMEVFTNSVTFTSVRLWCDSTVALTWIQTPPYKLKTYVANRVAQIQEMISPTYWSHISTTHNPADCASRGLLPSQLPGHNLWWEGPQWLHQPTDYWPVSSFQPINEEILDEVKTTPLAVLVSVEQEDWNFLSKFSSWTKLCSVTAYVLRFVHNLRHPNKLTGHLSVSELKTASSRIFKLVQGSSFQDDISAIKANKPVSSRLKRLTPFLDQDGILRVGGRLSASDLQYDSCHPIILPKKHHVVNIVIDHYHVKHLHAGTQLTQSLLTQKVWILSARSVVRSRIYKCLTCFRHRPRNKNPLMGNLPSARVTPSRPFLKTGVDYGGPFTVKIHNLRAIRHIKVYICVFVCFSTKAVHVEVVTDLSSDGFIAALTRFVCRRGLCTDIYSDCATNFVGADNALRKLIHSSGEAKVQQFFAQQGITFHFNPPAAPHQGGLWESAIKGVKHHLRRVMGEHVLTLPGFITLTTQAEAMMNSRPLTPLSSDPSDLTALTPGHFLVGGPLSAVPEPDVSSHPDNRLKNWHLVQALHQRLWKRWQLEYLHTLQQRMKWNSPTENLKIGDLVLVHQQTPPLTWPLARIVGVSPGKDKTVRVVHLKTTHGLLTRPAHKVFPLPCNSD